MVLIFDMDGVIVDNHQFHFESFVEFGKRHQLTISRKDFEPFFGRTNEVIMKSLFGNDISKEDILALANEKEAIYRELYQPFIKPLEGLTEFLQLAASRGIPIALATAAPNENVEFTLRETGLTKYFDAVTDSSMVTRGKPDPQVYLLTAAKLGVLPGDCIVFEDSVPGIVAAKNAGMRVIGVATTHKKDELLPHVKEIIGNFETAKILI